MNKEIMKNKLIKLIKRINKIYQQKKNIKTFKELQPNDNIYIMIIPKKCFQIPSIDENIKYRLEKQNTVIIKPITIKNIQIKETKTRTINYLIKQEEYDEITYPFKRILYNKQGEITLNEKQANTDKIIIKIEHYGIYNLIITTNKKQLINTVNTIKNITLTNIKPKTTKIINNEKQQQIINTFKHNIRTIIHQINTI